MEYLGQTRTVDRDYNHAIKQLYKLRNFDFAEIAARLIQFTKMVVGFFIVLLIFVYFTSLVLVLFGLVHHVLGNLFLSVSLQRALVTADKFWPQKPIRIWLQLWLLKVEWKYLGCLQNVLWYVRVLQSFVLKLQPAFFGGRINLWWFWVVLLIRIDFYVVTNWHILIHCAIRLFNCLVIFQI